MKIPNEESLKMHIGENFENAQQRKFETAQCGGHFENTQWRKVEANLQQVGADGRKVEESTQAPRPRSGDGNFIIVVKSFNPWPDFESYLEMALSELSNCFQIGKFF